MFKSKSLYQLFGVLFLARVASQSYYMLRELLHHSRWRLYILPRYLGNQTKLTRHMERYSLMAVVTTLTALLLSSLNDYLQNMA